MLDYVKLPIQEKPRVCTYMHQALKHAILESDFYLSDLRCELYINDTFSDLWKIDEEWARAEAEEDRLRVYVDKYEEKGKVTVSRKCQPTDELLVKVTYQQNTHPDALIDFSIWSGKWEDSSKGEHNIYKAGMVPQKGFFVFLDGDMKYSRNNDTGLKQYPIWIKMTKGVESVSLYTSEDGMKWEIVHEQEVQMNEAMDLNIGFRIIPLENQYYGWLYMNYLNLYLEPAANFIRLNYYNMPYRDYTDNFLHPFLLFNHYNGEEILDAHKDVHEFIHHSLMHKKYIWLALDEYYMPCRFAYGKMEYFHGNLIYGFDDKKRVYYILGYREKIVVDEVSYEDFDNAVRASLDMNKVTTILYKPNTAPIIFQKKYFVQAIKDYLSGENISYRTANILPSRQNAYFGIDIYKQLMAEDKNTMIVLKDARALYIIWEHNEIMKECLDFLIAKKYIVDYIDELTNEIREIALLCEKLKLTVIEVNVISKKKKIPLGESIERIRQILYSIYMKEIGFYSKLYQLLCDN